MLIGITGAARHGKDSVANLLVDKLGFIKLGFADAVREMAAAIDPYVHCGANRAFTEGDTPFARYSDALRYVGYENAKGYADVRRLLQRIGTEAGRTVLGESVWVDAMVRKIEALTTGFPLDADIVINDVRFENEATMVRALGGYLVRVTRPNFDNGLQSSHPSESAVASLDVDYDIVAESINDLLVSAEAAYAQFLTADRNKPVSPASTVAPLVYLAAPWAHKADAGDAKRRLQAAGITVVSGWTERENTPQEIDPALMAQQAILDRDEVRAANTLVILGLSKSEGKATEMGMALDANKRVILVKEDRVGNIFYNLPEVQRVSTLDEAIGLLLAGPNSTYIRVRENADGDKVDVATGQVVATRLGTVCSADTLDVPYSVTIHSVSNIDAETVNPQRLGVITDVASDPHEHELARHNDDGGPATEDEGV